MLGMSPETGIFLHGVHNPTEEKLECAGLHRILGTLLDSWRFLVVRNSSARDSMYGCLGEGSFNAELERLGF
jgi:hypothetical protein